MIAMSVTGDRAVILELKSIGIRLRERIREAVTRQTMALVAYVKTEKLSGQVLKTRSGTLRRKINGKVSETPTSVTGTIGAGNLAYALAHEYGFDGEVNVRAHVRQAIGGPVNVRAHLRHMHLPERSFLRSGLRDRRAAIAADLERAVAQAVA
jgi:hypothetical protein